MTLTPAVFSSVNGTKAGSFARGSSFNTETDKIQIFADANNDGVLTPSELVKTVNYNNGQTSTTVSQALANPSNPLADGTYTIYAVQVALDRYVNTPFRVGMINLKSVPPGAPAITSVSPLLNTIVQSTNPTFVGSSIAGVTIELFRSGWNHADRYRERPMPTATGRFRRACPSPGDQFDRGLRGRFSLAIEASPRHLSM